MFSKHIKVLNKKKLSQKELYRGVEVSHECHIRCLTKVASRHGSSLEGLVLHWAKPMEKTMQE